MSHVRWIIWRRLVIVLSLIGIGLSGCGGNSGRGDAGAQNTARLTLRLVTTSATSGSVAAGQPRQAVSGDVDFISRLRVVITADVLNISEEFEVTAEQQDEIVVDVDLGVLTGDVLNVTIEVTALNEANEEIFQGETTADLDLTEATQVVELTLEPINTPPVLDNPGDQVNAEGDLIELQMIASDDDDTLTFSALNLPPGLSLDANTGLISGTVVDTAAAGSPYNVTVTVQDASASDEVTFAWTVIVILHTAPGTVRIGSPDGPVAPEQTFTVQVVVHSDDTDIISYLFALTFDPEVIEVAGIANGLAPFDVPVTNREAFASGEVIFAANNSTFAAAHGLLNVALITFRVVPSPGAASELRLSFGVAGELVDRAYQPLADITFVDGQVRVN